MGTKWVLDEGLARESYLALRFGIGALVFAAVVLVLEGSLRISGRDALWVAGAVVLFALNQFAFVYALELTTAVTVALIGGLMPIFIALISSALRIEALTWRVIAGGLVSFTGVSLVVLGIESGLSELSGEAVGVLVALGVALSFGAFTVVVAPPMRNHSPYRVSALIMLATAVPFVALGTKPLLEQDLSAPGGLGWLSVAWSILAALVLAQLAWFGAIERVGPSRASAFVNVQPFGVVIFAAILIGEHLRLIQLAGGVLIAVGIAFTRSRPSVTLVE